MKNLIYYVLCASLIVAGCNSTGSKNKGNKLTDINVSEESDNTPVNVLEQAKPTIMVLPSDKLLRTHGAFGEESFNGKTYYTRDYQKYLLEDPYSRQVIGAIQNKFLSLDFPLTDLEQSLKKINDQSIIDAADNLSKDAKTALLSVCKPDILIELDYVVLDNPKSSSATNDKYIQEYILSSFDSFTSKAIASIKANDVGYDTKGRDLNTVFTESLNKTMSSFTTQLTNYFSDLLSKGREITFRVTVRNSSSLNLSDEYNSLGDTYSDWIREWIKVNSKKGAATLQMNTEKEMQYVNVRITNTAEDGTQNNAYDFANAFRKEFVKTFNIGCTNATCFSL